MVLAVALAGCTFTGSADLGKNTSAPPEQPSTPPAQPSAPSGCTFTGTWETNWGEMVLLQEGADVTGNYTFDEGKINGTVSGKTLTGWWSEISDESPYMPPDNAGNVILNLTDDCNGIEGAWRYGSEGDFTGGWEGNRKK